jgi:hypothetical protein
MQVKNHHCNLLIKVLNKYYYVLIIMYLKKDEINETQA